MFRAVLRNFETYKDIRHHLLQTENEEFVESAPGDFYWGCSGDGTVQNKLGKILMDVRSQLRAAQNQVSGI